MTGEGGTSRASGGPGRRSRAVRRLTALRRRTGAGRRSHADPGPGPGPDPVAGALAGQQPAAGPAAGPSPAEEAAEASRETEALLEVEHAAARSAALPGTRHGPPLNRRSPFYFGLVASLGAFAGYGLVLLLLAISHILVLVVVALFLALGMEPVVQRLGRRGIARGWAVLLITVIASACLALLGWLVIPTLTQQVADFVVQVPAYVASLQHNRILHELDARFTITDRLLQKAEASITNGGLTSVFGGVLGAGKAFVDGLVSTFTVFVLTLYFMAAMPRVKAAAYLLVPHRRRARVVFLSEEISRRVGGFLLGQLTVAVINALLSYTVLVILGVPFPVILAILMGLLGLVPIVGTLLGGVIVTLVAATVSWLTALIMLGYYVLFHLFEAYVLGPRVMRRAVAVPPVLTIVAVLAGGALLGILGAVLAIPVAAGLLLIYEEVLVPRQQRD